MRPKGLYHTTLSYIPSYKRCHGLLRTAFSSSALSITHCQWLCYQRNYI